MCPQWRLIAHRASAHRVPRLRFLSGSRGSWWSFPYEQRIKQVGQKETRCARSSPYPVARRRRPPLRIRWTNPRPPGLRPGGHVCGLLFTGWNSLTPSAALRAAPPPEGEEEDERRRRRRRRRREGRTRGSREERERPATQHPPLSAVRCPLSAVRCPLSPVSWLLPIGTSVPTRRGCG